MIPRNLIFMVFAYILVGICSVIVAAYLRKLLYNDAWFTKGGWTSSWDDLFPSPVFVLVFWPIIGLVSILVFTISGIFTGIGELAEKAEKTAEAQRKRVGNHRENPR